MKCWIRKLSLNNLCLALNERYITAFDTVLSCFDKINEDNDVINAFVCLSPGAEMEALDVDQRRGKSGSNEHLAQGPLAGVPIAVKDLIDVCGMRTSAASRVLKGLAPATKDAACVGRLRAAGAIVLGKTNLHEFAYGVTGVVSAFGPTRNPLDRTRVSGGSSSGSAAALAAGMCFGALGTDTAGSIRLPAACCGVVGFKPSWGAIPVSGVIPLAWSYDHVGPMARTVNDVGVLYAVLTGEDCQWGQVRRSPEKPLRCGILRKYFCEGLAPEVAAGFDRAVDAARQSGWELREVEIPTDPGDEDGLAFHEKWINAESWGYHQHWLPTRGRLYDPRTLPRILGGKGVAFEAYAEARRRLELLREQRRNGIAGVDVLLSPTLPVLPPLLEEVTEPTPQALALEHTMLRNTCPFDVLGWPTVTVPCAPMVGVQVSAGWGRDWLALSAARELERALTSVVPSPEKVATAGDHAF